MSQMYYTIKGYYDTGRWNKQRVREAVECGAITPAEYKRITKEAY